MTLLGAPTSFSLGSSSNTTDPTEMSLDQLIESRRKDQKQQANADRSIATSRVKRQARMDAKRGKPTATASHNKPTRMEIETAVQQEQNKTAQRKLKQQQQQQLKQAPPNKKKGNFAQRKEQLEMKSAARQQAKSAPLPPGTKPPPRKAVKAALGAMKETGYQIPEGMKMKIVFEPKNPPKQQPQQQQQQDPSKKKKNTPQQQQPQHSQQQQGRGNGGGGGGRGRNRRGRGGQS